MSMPYDLRDKVKKLSCFFYEGEKDRADFVFLFGILIETVSSVSSLKTVDSVVSMLLKAVDGINGKIDNLKSEVKVLSERVASLCGQIKYKSV